jgi:prolyl-tRNA editing enzyme YbaK/EbsC (Cys-tRNA(Pro) deacylase)
MKPASSPAALRVQAALGPGFAALEFDASTRTAAEAAAIGCTVAQIAKSLVFRASQSGRAVVVVASGARSIRRRERRSCVHSRSSRRTPFFD